MTKIIHKAAGYMKNNLVKVIAWPVMAMLFLGSIGANYYFQHKKIQKIQNFEQCAEAGYPVLESYPAQCNAPDGRHFVQELNEEQKAVLPAQGCKNLCGDGICQEYVCMAIGCPCAETKESCPQDCLKQENMPGLANPASVNCVNKGGKSEIRTNPDGSQTGYCIFPDGSQCEEWAFFRNQCPR